MYKATIGLTIALLAGGCPGGSDTSSGDGGPPGTGDGGTPSDGSSTARGSGYLAFSSTSYQIGGTPVKFSSVSAGFGAPSMAPACVLTTVGVCQLSVCQIVAPAADGGTPTYPEAGKITLTGGTRMVTLAPAADGAYEAAVDTMNALWNGGETLAVTAQGSRVPAFNFTLTAPSPATLTVPAAPAPGNKLMVNRRTDLALKWSGGQSGKLQVSASTFVVPTSTSLVCTFAAADGMGVIPAATLQNLPMGSGGFTVNTVSTKMLPAGSYDLSVTAQSLAGDSNGSVASFSAVYQ